jgi:hypothetical protein
LSKNRKTQDWTPGSIVKVGFLTLTVTGIEATPGDSRPDRYLLQHSNGKRYAFTPHFGIERL